MGPFPRPSEAGWAESLDQICVNEPNVNLDGSQQVGETTLKWQRYTSEQGMIDLEKLFDPHANVSTYAYAELHLPQEQQLLLKIGSDDSFKCWFNGQVVGRYEGDRGWVADQDALQVEGRKGINTVLIKITQGGNEWAFSARVTDARNNPVQCQVK
jgi:hypothetical protein